MHNLRNSAGKGRQVLARIDCEVFQQGDFVIFVSPYDFRAEYNR
jgi:hypothetical protein